MCDYIDVYYFKWLGNNRTFNEALNVLPSASSNLKPGFFISPYDNFTRNRDIGLPKNYDPKIWWESTQNELVELFLETTGKSKNWYEELKIGDSNKQGDEGEEFEAFTMLQLEAEGLFYGVYRPSKPLNSQEKLLNTDARFKSYNQTIISGNPTIIDIKRVIDPAALAARNRYERSLDLQLNLKTYS